MKNKLFNLLMLVALFLPSSLLAQNDPVYYTLGEDKTFSHWSYMIDVGASIFDGDVYESNGQKLVPTSNFKPTVGINIERSFNPVFGLGLQYKYIPYKASPDEVSYELKGQANEANIFLSMNLLNLFYQSRKQKWNLYANVGLGVSFYSAEMTSKATGEPIPDPYDKGEVMKLDDGNAFVWPISLLLEYNIGKNFALGLQAEYRMHNKDNFEGSTGNTRKGTSNDGFALFSVSFRHKIHIKKKETHVRNISYGDINMKDIDKRIDSMKDEVKDEVKALQEQDEICCINAMNKIAELETLLAQKQEPVIIVKDEKAPEPVVIVVEKIEKVFNLALRGIQFETAKAIIKPVSYPILDNVGDIMKEYPDFELDIIGHTDNVGNEAYNKDLSEERANSVKQYLIDKGISANRLTAAGKGPNNPVSTNTTPEGRALNRRVEFVVRNGNEIIYKTEKITNKETAATTVQKTQQSQDQGQKGHGEQTKNNNKFDPSVYEMTYVVAEKGTRLALFSTQYYGSYMFWPYIYLANKDVLKDGPGNLNPGTKIRIPKLPKEMIDENNQQAVDRVNYIKDHLDEF